MKSIVVRITSNDEDFETAEELLGSFLGDPEDAERFETAVYDDESK